MNTMDGIMDKMRKGFTLIELLIVVCIMLILAAATYIFLNPLELRDRKLDLDRLSDLISLNQAINLAVQESTSSATSILCKDAQVPCSGSSHTGSRAVDGTGWVKVGLTVGGPLSSLPVDPINSNTHHYSYCSDGTDWELNTVLESDKQSSEMSTDKGNDTDKYEVGSNLQLIAPSGGSCTY